MASNPFNYGSPVTGEQFTGREREVDAVVRRIRDHVNVLIQSPRRYGKTSILLRAEEQLEPTRPAIISINVLLTRDLTAFVGRLVTEAWHLPGSGKKRGPKAIGEFINRLRFSPSVTFRENALPTFHVGAGLTERDADMAIEDVFALLDELSEKRPAALILDEFQAITDLGEHLPRLFKALSDKYRGVSLVVAGSKRHLIDALVTDDGAPLYGMMQRIDLGPIDEDEMRKYVIRQFAAAGKPINDVVVENMLVGVASPIPNNIQRLAYETFNGTDATVTAGSVDAAIQRIVDHEAGTFADMFGQRSLGQRKVLIALANGSGTAAMSRSFVDRTGLANASSVKRALDALDALELVARSELNPAFNDSSWSIADPFFEEWVRRIELGNYAERCNDKGALPQVRLNTLSEPEEVPSDGE